jgi:hypothetical protein
MLVAQGVLDQRFRPTASVKEASARLGGRWLAWVPVKDPGDGEAEPTKERNTRRNPQGHAPRAGGPA